MLLGGLLLGLLCNHIGLQQQQQQQQQQQEYDDSPEPPRYHSQISAPLLRFLGTLFLRVFLSLRSF
eukprot:COSAG02_NODE_1526_length_12092_cov_10.672392_8_plen_66_part_00